jgi:hypothetical protein
MIGPPEDDLNDNGKPSPIEFEPLHRVRSSNLFAMQCRADTKLQNVNRLIDMKGSRRKTDVATNRKMEMPPTNVVFADQREMGCGSDYSDPYSNRRL